MRRLVGWLMGQLVGRLAWWSATHPRVIRGADVDLSASQNTAAVHIHRRWRRPVEVVMQREDMMEMLALVADGEIVGSEEIRVTYHPVGGEQ